MAEDFSSNQRKTFGDYLKKKEDENETGLRKKIFDYILEKAKLKNLKSLSRKSVSKIEDDVEDILEDTIDMELNEVKQREMNSRVGIDHIHFDNYDAQRKLDDRIEIKEEIPEHIHFDDYELPKKD